MYDHTCAESTGTITFPDLENLLELMQFLIACFFFFLAITTNLGGSQNIMKVPL